jgi:DNA topoisomerase-6 subunit B
MVEGMKLENMPACSVQEALKRIRKDRSGLREVIDGLSEKDRLDVPRRTDIMPAQPVETKPHPSGVDYDLLKRMSSRTRYERIADFLKGEFDRPADTAKRLGICKVRWAGRSRPSSTGRAFSQLMPCARRAPPPSPEARRPWAETLVQGEVSATCLRRAVTRRGRCGPAVPGGSDHRLQL